MDLRIIKTKKAIREAFIQLREKNELEKIKVIDLCEIAMINKTTFYKYYSDMIELGSEMENQFFEEFWNRFEAKELLFTDTAQFISRLPESLDAEGDMLTILFRDRFDRFFTLFESELVRIYVREDLTRAEQIRRSFAIRGLVHMLKEVKINRTWTTNELAEVLEPVIRGI